MGLVFNVNGLLLVGYFDLYSFDVCKVLKTICYLCNSPLHNVPPFLWLTMRISGGGHRATVDLCRGSAVRCIRLVNLLALHCPDSMRLLGHSASGQADRPIRRAASTDRPLWACVGT